jgi:hypothetical protein
MVIKKPFGKGISDAGTATLKEHRMGKPPVDLRNPADDISPTDL